jgi:hypothetical protein
VAKRPALTLALGLARSPPGSTSPTKKKGDVMVFDILVALVITAIAVVLGVTVHPLLLFIIVLAVVYLVARRRSRV